MDAADRWRVIDTGLQTPAHNVALDRALLEAREADEIPSTLRFHRYTPAVLLSPLQEGDPLIDMRACEARGLAVAHRLTDGGTFLCDGPHLAWTLYLGRSDLQCSDGRTVLKRLCHAAAAGIAALGVDAAYRARNEIVVDGRMLARAGVLHSDDTVMFQAVLALDADVAQRALLLDGPWGMEERHVLLGDRVTTLSEQLARKPDTGILKRNLTEAYESEFAVEFRDADLTLSEQARYEAAEREQAAGVPGVAIPRARVNAATAVHSRDGACVSAYVVFDSARIIRHVWFTGCTLKPGGALADLEAALCDVPADRIEGKVRSFFASRPVLCERCAPDDFIAVIRRAVDQQLLAR